MSSAGAGSHHLSPRRAERRREERPVPDRITGILLEFKNLAIVGVSPKPWRPSHGIASYMRAHGYRVIAVNPNLASLFDEPCYPSLAEVPGDVEVVVIFRSQEHVPEIVEDAIRKNARVVWMQEGIRNDEGVRRARRAGLEVIEDRCILKEHAKRFMI